ncbi:hypothetical protein FC831_13945 [Clostridium botulinum]|nr:hypothetical protein [Clostridium botulinum]
MIVFIDIDTKEKTVILNDKNKLKEFYNIHKDDIFVGYNSRGYDQWIMKGILLGKNPCRINDDIIVHGKNGYQVVRDGNKIKLNNYDVADIQHSLKQYEGYMGHMIKESDVPFDLDRPLTKDEIEKTIFYCTHDVEETIELFNAKINDFNSHLLLIETFDLSMEMFNKTKAQISAHILGGVKQSRIDDEFDYLIPNNLNLGKYKYILDWYLNPRNKTYGRKLITKIAGVEHTLGFGGIHSALPNYKGKGIFAHADVASLYPSLMIKYKLLSRNVKNPNKFKEIKDKRLELKRLKDGKQGALKIVINATFGISKDRNSSLYDPKMANSVCITGQLLNVDLVDKIESCGQLIQNNTDGVVFKYESIEDLERSKKLAHEWEVRTGLDLEWEVFDEIYQRDVNNYIMINSDKTFESKGCVKKKSKIDNNLPIVTKAILDYCITGVPIEDTINSCNELMQFQAIVKASGLYQYTFYGNTKQIEHEGKKVTVENEGHKLNEKVLRVFASKDDDDMGVYKVKNKYKVEKIAGTPDKCFIYNDNVVDIDKTKEKELMNKLDKQYYINFTNDTLKDFLGENDVELKKTSEEQLQQVLNNNYNHFYDVLEYVKLNTKITNSMLEKYITVDKFKQYGKSKKLIEFSKLFKLLYGKLSGTEKSLSKKLTPNQLEILKLNSEYDNEKGRFKNINCNSALCEMFDCIDDIDIILTNKIRREFDMYNDVSIKDDGINENILFIMAVNDTHNPSIIAYNPKHGTTNILKIPKNTFNILQINVTDFILVKKYELSPKVKVDYKDEKGINIIGKDELNKEWWITQYDIVDRDYKKFPTINEEC